MKSGVYRIYNTINTKVYIGSSQDILCRKSEHFTELRNGNHHSVALQRAFDKYGEDGFIFEIIEECSIERLLTREQYYLDLYKCYRSENGYNISIVAGAPMRDRVHTKETRDKMSSSRKGVLKTDEWKQKMRDSWSRRKKLGYTPKSRSKESIEKQRRTITGKARQPHTEETKRKISIANQGKIAPNRKSVVQLTLDGQFINRFASITEAALQFNKSGAEDYIKASCVSTDISYKGFRWTF